MPNTALASHKVFDFDDQRSFAAVTGDHNPMHLDAVAARRTPAGAPVVHGVNVLLWALETFARALERPPPVRKLRARFHKFVYVGETARVDAAEQTDRGLRLSVSVNGSAVVRVVIDFGEPTLAYQDIDPA